MHTVQQAETNDRALPEGALEAGFCRFLLLAYAPTAMAPSVSAAANAVVVVSVKEAAADLAAAQAANVERQARIRRGVHTVAADVKTGGTAFAVKLNNVGAMETSLVRPFLTEALNSFFAFRGQDAEDAAPQLARLWQVQLWLETEVARQLPRSPANRGRSRLPTYLADHGRSALVASEAAAADGLSRCDAPAASAGSAGGSAARAAAAEAHAQQALREGGARRQRLSRLSFALHMGGEAHSSELRLDEGYTIDLALEARRVAVVVAGKAQYDQLPRADGTYAPTTAARLGWRQLGALGWEVVLVPWYEWDALDSTAERRDYIDERLLRAGGAAAEGGCAPAGAAPAWPAEAAEAAEAAESDGGEAQKAGLETLESELKAARARISELEKLVASGPPRE